MRNPNSPTKLLIAVCTLFGIAASLGATLASASAGRSRLSAAGSGTTAIAPMALDNPHTDLDVFALGQDRKLAGKLSARDFYVDYGFNIVRTFRTSTGELRLFALNGNTGRIQVYAIDADGSIGASTFVANPQKAFRCTGALFVKTGETVKLVTLDSFTGVIRKFTVADNGAPNVATATAQVVDDMKDKNLFSAYSSQISPYQSLTSLVGVDTWTGKTATYSLDLQKITTPLWTRGWTSIDHLNIGSVTYRLLYKASGDPYKKPGESGDQARRFMIERVNSAGETETLQNTTLGSDGGDISSVRFVQFPGLRAGSAYGILLYRRTTGDYAVYEFDPQVGLGDKLDAGTLTEGGTRETPVALPYIDVEPYLINNKTCFALVSPDNAKPLGYEQAERVGQMMNDSLTGQTVGYQFILAQSGRIYFSRGAGKNRLDHNDSLETDMTTRTQLNVGSVSKVITSMTMMKLVEQGKLNLNDNISKYLTSNQYNQTSWVKKTPVLNLLAHTSGMSEDNKAKCSVDSNGLKVDCTNFFNGTPDSNPACGYDSTGKWNCNRSYNNWNTVAAREVIEFITGATTSPAIVSQTRQLWANDSDLENMTCKVNPKAYYYGACDGAGDCFQYEGKSWRRDHPADSAQWSEYCSSGGWNASSREMIEFLGSIRYRKSLSQTATDQFLNTALKDINNSKTAVGWDPAWTSDGEENLNKGGYLPSNGTAAKAFITRLPNNCDAVLQLNSEGDISGTQLLRDAYNVAVLGATVIAKSGDYFNPLDFDLASRTAINTVSSNQDESRHVVVFRASGGNLKVKAFSAPRLPDVPDLVPFAEKTASGVQPALSSDDVAITDGPNFATASLGIGNSLNIIAWNLNGGQLTQHASTIWTYGREVAAAKVASAGSLTRIVTAIADSDRKLQLDVWDINNIVGLPQFSTITHKDSFTGLPAEALDIKSLGTPGDFSKPARFVVAFHLNYELHVQSFQVDATGNLSSLDKQYFNEFPVTSWDTPERLSLDTAGDGISKFFNGKGFVSTYIAGSRKLTVVTWAVDPAGKISFVDRMQTSGEVGLQAVSATTSIVTLTDDSEKFVKLIKWQVSDAGLITRTWSLTPSVQVTSIAATNNLVGAFSHWPTTNLRLINWVIVNP